MTQMRNLLALQEAVWVGLMVYALQCVLLGWRLRRDPLILALGVSLLLLGLMAGTDVCISYPATLDGNRGHIDVDFWNLAYNFLACAYLTFAMVYTRQSTGRPARWAVLANTVAFSVFAILFIVDIRYPGALMLETDLKGGYRTSFLYDFVFAPAGVVSFVTVIVATWKKARESAGRERRAARFLIAGYLAVLAGGLADLFVTILNIEVLTISFVTPGVMALGMIAALVMADRFLGLYEERRDCIVRLARAREDLETERPLKAIGSSAAMVSHEVKNYLSIIKGNVRMASARGLGGGRVPLDRIDRARASLESLTVAILAYSRSHRVNPATWEGVGWFLMSHRMRLHPDRHGDIRFGPLVPGDDARLDSEPFLEAMSLLARNAFEAGASRLDIRIRRLPGKVLLVLTDDGAGCRPEDAVKIPLPFYTTRKQEGAHGLGAAIAKGIITGHGGSISFLARRADKDAGAAGLEVNIVLPAASPYLPGGEILILTRDAGLGKHLAQACANLGRTARLMVGAGDQAALDPALEPELILAEAEGATLEAAKRLWPRCPCMRLDPGVLTADPRAGWEGDAAVGENVLAGWLGNARLP